MLARNAFPVLEDLGASGVVLAPGAVRCECALIDMRRDVAAMI